MHDSGTNERAAQGGEQSKQMWLAAMERGRATKPPFSLWMAVFGFQGEMT